MTKKLLTIGAGPGIALETAKRFADAGFDLVLASRDPARLRARAQERFGTRFDATYATVDAGIAADVAELVAATNADVLHYNAGVLRYRADGTMETKPITAFTLEDIGADLRINVTGALAAIHAALAGMQARREGTILLTGGGLALSPHPELLTLSVGKAALRAAAQGLFEAAKASDVHVAVLTVAKLVSPGSAAAAQVADAAWALHMQPKDRWTWEATIA